MIIIGVLLQIWGGTILFHRTQKYRKNADNSRGELNQKSDTTLTLSKENERLNLKITSLSEKSNSLGQENKILNEQIRNLSNRISEQSIIIENEITGGDSYGEVSFLHLGYPDDLRHSFNFHNRGDYPLYDVSITVRNQTLIKQKMKERKDKGMVTVNDLQYYKTYSLGTVPPNMGKPFGNLIRLNDNEIHYYGFSISTKNRSFSQLYKFLKKGGKYYSAVYLNPIKKKNEKSLKVLIDKADEGFPGEENGKIKWKDK